MRRRFNPFWEMENMINSFANAYNSVFDDEPRFKGDFSPKADIWEDDFNVHFEFELPGVNKEDIKISVNDNRILSVSGEKKVDSSLNGKTCCRNERNYGHFIRTFQLPDELNTNKIKAHFENGILTISIEKVKATEPKEMVIEVV
ncbi:MAG: Hsp20/alpha crystallin family protein [Candidatus Kapaibacteriales bacterium]